VQQLTFDINVHNNGSVDLMNVAVSDPSLNCPALAALPTVLAAGASFTTVNCNKPTITSTYTNTITATGTALVTNTAEAQIVGTNTVVSESVTSSLDVEDVDTAVVKINPAGIAIDKQATVVDPNTVRYEITVTNTGNAPAIYLITDTLPSNLTNISCSPGTVASGELTHSLLLNASQSIAITCTADADVSLAISKTPDTQAINLGDDAIFNITITNTGAFPLRNVQVTDADALCGIPLSIASLSVGETADFQCNTIDVMSPFTNTITATADALIENTAQAQIAGVADSLVSDSADFTLSDLVTDTAVVKINPAGIDLDKTVEDLGNGTLKYTIGLTNTGDSSAQYLITDTFPTELTNINCSAGTLSGQMLTTAITLTGGESELIVCTVSTHW
jgi:uncharacterized repeat protein (TIGR01451 family)